MRKAVLAGLALSAAVVAVLLAAGGSSAETPANTPRVDNSVVDVETPPQNSGKTD